MVDLDRQAVQEYTPEVIVSISKSIAMLQKSSPALPLDKKAAEELLSRSRTGAGGVPQLIWNMMQEVKTDV